MSGLGWRRRQVALLAAGSLAPRLAVAAPVGLRAADGVSVTGDSLTASRNPSRGMVLLFHMAGSNLGEYATIAPEFARRGFDTLAIDQRSGGPGWGRRNETAARLPRDPGFAAALPDLEAALAHARQRQRQPQGRVLVLGSSYSAALVLVLAARAGASVSAVLAFSPGEYLSGVSVRAAAAHVTCPVFVTQDSDRSEQTAAAAILAAVPGRPKRQFNPVAGAHGASILRPDRNPHGAAAAWTAVDAFLDEIAPA